jgi:hypothetical protein
VSRGGEDDRFAKSYSALVRLRSKEQQQQHSRWAMVTRTTEGNRGSWAETALWGETESRGPWSVERVTIIQIGEAQFRSLEHFTYQAAATATLPTHHELHCIIPDQNSNSPSRALYVCMAASNYSLSVAAKSDSSLGI